MGLISEKVKSLFCPENIYTTSGADDSLPSNAVVKNMQN
jgi:hypothetical protein